MTLVASRTEQRYARSSKRSERMLVILEMLTHAETVTLDLLSDALNVSAATVRRDLADLEAQLLLRRTHGGARMLDGPSSTQLELPVPLKNSRFREAKRLIARKVATLIPTGRHVVALSGGSTTAEAARMLANRRELTVVTNSLTIASQLAARQTIQLIMTGGVARPPSFELVGLLAERSFSAINVGTAVLGTDGITATGGATTYDETEARTNLAMVSGAGRVIVIADGSKVGRATLAPVVGTEQIHDLVTDSSADADELERVRAQGVRVHLADA